MQVNEELNKILNAAFNEAKKRNHEFITPEHILYASLFFESGLDIIKNCGGNVSRLSKKLEMFFNEKLEKVENQEPIESSGFQSVIENALYHTASAQKEEIDIGDIYASLFEEKNSFAAFYLSQEGISRIVLLNYISHGITSQDGPLDENQESQQQTQGKQNQQADTEKILKLFTTELTEKAKKGEIEPLIGRQSVLERTIQVLCRRFKNNPIHVGEPGVGKTAITEGLAQMIADGNVPKPLKNAKVYALDMGSLLAGTKFRGDFEERMKRVLNTLLKEENAILFIDEIHTVVGAGAVSGGTMDASNILKPVLTGGKLKCIGSTTYEEYKKHFDKDRALSRRFQKIEIPEPTIEETIEILKGLKTKYENFHQVKYTDAAIHTAAELSAKYINDRHLPDKAIDVLDEAGAYSRVYGDTAEGKKTQITPKQIEKIVSQMAKIPEKTVSVSEVKKLQFLEKELKNQIFGQDQPIERVVAAIKTSRAGFRDPNKPIASFLFVGPTGVGKTELAKQLANCMGVPLIRFDMSEYEEKHTISRLIGAPPGYVGYEEGGLLTEAVRKTPYSVLLLDEIEKAHQDIFNILLQVMDYATLTDNNGKKADFRNVILILTSNAGAREIGKSNVGFGEQIIKSDIMKTAVDKIFAPEFRNRLDSVVFFNHLNLEMTSLIVKKALKDFQEQLLKKKVHLEVPEEVIQWLSEKSYSPVFGAREVSRLVQEKVKNFFVEEILFGKLSKGGKAILTIENNEIQLKTK